MNIYFLTAPSVNPSIINLYDAMAIMDGIMEAIIPAAVSWPIFVSYIPSNVLTPTVTGLDSLPRVKLNPSMNSFQDMMKTIRAAVIMANFDKGMMMLSII